MFNTKYISAVLGTGLLFYFTGCTSAKIPVSEEGYYHSGIYFGKQHFSDIYEKGIKDGCTTAKGYYAKSHTLFNNNKDYHDGWFLGRNKCRNLLAIEKND